MNKTELMAKATRTFHRVGFKIKKHSPEILIGVGIAGSVTSAVMACKATTKIDTILSNTRERMEVIHTAAEVGNVSGEEYTAEDCKKDTVIVYAQTAVEFAKLYGPSVLLGGVSIGCILAGGNILRKRNVALAAAYTAVDTGFKDYRNRVIERFGKELDRELKYNIQSMKVEETVTDENGKTKKVKKTVEAIDPNQYSVYSRIYDDGCIGWEKDAEQNRFFLQQAQNYFNDLLKTRGHVFLNEIYDYLGFDRTAYGNVVGWVYNEEHPFGDNFIDFGMFDIHNAKARDFMNGRERVIVLDFNVDGNILNLI